MDRPGPNPKPMLSLGKTERRRKRWREGKVELREAMRVDERKERTRHRMDRSVN